METNECECCVNSIKSLADAVRCCHEQHGCHKIQSNKKGCDCCKEAIKLTLDAMQKHLDCLRSCC